MQTVDQLVSLCLSVKSHISGDTEHIVFVPSKALSGLSAGRCLPNQNTHTGDISLLPQLPNTNTNPLPNATWCHAITVDICAANSHICNYRVIDSSALTSLSLFLHEQQITARISEINGQISVKMNVDIPVCSTASGADVTLSWDQVKTKTFTQEMRRFMHSFKRLNSLNVFAAPLLALHPKHPELLRPCHEMHCAH